MPRPRTAEENAAHAREMRAKRVAADPGGSGPYEMPKAPRTTRPGYPAGYPPKPEGVPWDDKYPAGFDVRLRTDIVRGPGVFVPPVGETPAERLWRVDKDAARAAFRARAASLDANMPAATKRDR